MSEGKDNSVETAFMVLINHFANGISQTVAETLNHTGRLYHVEEKSVYTPSEVATKLGISKDLVYKELVYKPGFPIIRIGKRILIPADSFHRWLNEQGKEKNI